MDSPHLIVVFGAGASYDGTAEGQAERRPPLARDLFSPTFTNWIAAHRPAGPLIRELRALPPDASLEAELDRIQNDEAPNDSTRRREIVALRYYLRDLLWEKGEASAGDAPGHTNYHMLLERLARWRERTKGTLALVSFNYDPMLEIAIQDVLPMRLTTMEHYLADPQIKVFRPHGSVRWMRVIANDTLIVKNRGAEETEREVIDLAGREGLQLADVYHVVRDRTTTTIGGRILLPALTVPIQRKRDFEFPKEHEDAFAASTRLALYVLIVGWRATEQNFLELWAKAERMTQPRMMTVNGPHIERGNQALEALSRVGIRWSQYEAFEGGFTKFLAGDGLKRFLETPF